MAALLFLFVKQIFSFIDRMVVFVIKYLYQLIVAIADTNVFGDLIYQYLGRIYMFLSVFMVFKLSISIINYIVNPDAMTDKNTGFGKLITNVVISLILLAVTPNIFEIAFDLQKDLLNSNAVYQIVTGKQLDTGQGNSNMYENAKVSAESIAFGVYSGFVYQVVDEDSDEPSKSGEEFGAYCDPDDVKSGCNEKTHICKSTTCLLDADTVTAKENKYWWLISTACGCVVAYILLGFCVDTAVRSVKLGFLQIIAPVPIMLRMDPKDKGDKFNKWLKETATTFLSLFIRLAALFFAVDLINVVVNPKTNPMISYSGAAEIGGGGLTGVFVKIFVVIGCLLFAKQFPQLLSDLLGIKLDGDGFSLKKKLGGIPGLGAAKMVGAGALGFAGGMAANTWAGVRNWDKSKNGFKGTLSNLGKIGNSITAGAFSGAYRGLTSKEKNMFKAAGAGISGAAAARNLRVDRKAAGDGGLSGVARRTGVAAANLAGLPSGASKFDKQISSYDSFLKEQSSLYSYAESKVAEDAGFMVDNFTYTQADGTEFTWNGGALNLAQEQAALNKMEQDPTVDTATLVNQRSVVEAMKKKATTDYITLHKEDGGAVQAALSNLEYMRSTNDSINAEISAPITDGAAVESAKKTIKGAKSRTTSSSEYRQAQINKKNDAKN